MNIQSEVSVAREAIEIQIRIASKEEAIRGRLLTALDTLSGEGVLQAHSFLTATLAEKVAISVEMLMGFLGVKDEVAEEA